MHLKGFGPWVNALKMDKTDRTMFIARALHHLRRRRGRSISLFWTTYFHKRWLRMSQKERGNFLQETDRNVALDFYQHWRSWGPAVYCQQEFVIKVLTKGQSLTLMFSFQRDGGGSHSAVFFKSRTHNGNFISCRAAGQAFEIFSNCQRAAEHCAKMGWKRSARHIL